MGTLRYRIRGGRNDESNYACITSGTDRSIWREIKGTSRIPAMRPEQKSEVWMQDIVRKISKPAHVPVDLCDRAIATEKACIMLLRHHRCIGWEIDKECYNQSYISKVETFSREDLTEDLDCTGLEGVAEVPKGFVKAMDGMAARTREVMWEAPPELSPMQSFPSHSPHFLSNVSKDSSPFKLWKGVPLSSWSAKSGMPVSIVKTRAGC